MRKWAPKLVSVQHGMQPTPLRSPAARLRGAADAHVGPHDR
jgi:hypothetical protein